ncbi:PTS system glucitol/sorbitol-specific transporter subunit IIA [Pasteurella multocida subsp. multocida str. Anand1_buffalo]|nr:PTS system glucitol/sorbitol-specific transporter subunit IIA [Pasteurella multocida subsp. multocida str. Anand1_buffalo]
MALLMVQSLLNFPGSIHLQGPPPESVAINSLFTIKRDEK